MATGGNIDRPFTNHTAEQTLFIQRVLKMARINAAIVTLSEAKIVHVDAGPNNEATAGVFFPDESFIHPDDRPAVTAYYSFFPFTFDNEEDIIVYRIKNSGDDWTHIKLSSTVWKRDNENNVEQMLVISQEINTANGIYNNLTDASSPKVPFSVLQYPDDVILQLRGEILHKLEGKYRTLFNSMDEGYCIIQMLYDSSGKPCDWRYIEVNPAFELHNGLTNATGKTIRELTPDIEQKWIDIYGRVAETGESIRFEEDSTALQRVFDLYAFRIGEPGERMVAVLFTNITDRRKAEKILLESESRKAYLLKLSDALRPVADAREIQRIAMKLLAEQIGVVRASYFEVAADNDGVFQTAGYETGDLHLPEFTRLSDFGNQILEAYRAGSTVVVDDMETAPGLENMRPAYRALGVRAWAGVPLVKNGTLLAVLGLYESTPRCWTPEEINILEETAERTWAGVERARSEQALRESEQQLIRMVKLRDEFVNVASHELKTPLTSVKAYAQIVEEKLNQKGDEDNRELLSRLNLQIDRLSGLVNSLLDSTKVSEGQLRLHLEQTDVSQIVTDCIAEIRTAARQHVKLALAPVPIIIADRERIGQVITNLLSNAVKYSAPDSTIYISCSLKQNKIEISVRDEGYGIPKKDLTRIFEKFFRVTANGMDTFPGMGLGLYISAQIIQMHGGEISAQSEVGKGSVFSFFLPV